MTAPPSSVRPHDPTPLDDATRLGDQQHPDRAQPEPAGTPAAGDEQRLSLSATQITASMAAAVIAAMVGSKLGVAGTVIGAGLASVISVVGGAVFGHSILLTRKQLKRAVAQVRGGDRDSTDPANITTRTTMDHSDDRTVVIPAVTRYDLARASSGSATDSARRTTSFAPGPMLMSTPERSEPRRPRPIKHKLGAGLLVGAAAAAAIFAGSLAAVTLVETVKGSPLSGGDSGGLSVLGGTGGTDSDPTVAPTTTTQVTELSTVTQTVTSAPTDSASTSEQPTTASSAAPSTSASSTPSASAPVTSGGAGASADANRTSATTPPASATGATPPGR